MHLITLHALRDLSQLYRNVYPPLYWPQLLGSNMPVTATKGPCKVESY